ncbi:GPI transamidase component [Wickerhamomyces ciferrii]|uniref:GPI transamidase component n=1 Tax=Wickerhamomyces ciferrii (strain ATCC 14091 / BCRC 22168 / CBS 111 / JCM 3599 / NBRC 0793 / NRRL Y-1031 F-60-10) TaxID=1206466 RepID=K0KQ20_WICCF|nr:GPI transamidase component [Wickerhamomyces ciferrii]CCH45141.1 GPI transamidase component [Wickerhamomyces ciferrii]
MKIQLEALLGLLALSHSVVADGPASNHSHSINEDVFENATAYPYEETLDITPLPRNNLLISFNFNIASEYINVSESKSHHQYRAFPRSLAPILESTDTRELHLRFGQGWWDSEEWGQLPYSGEHSGGVGVEVWSVIEAAGREQSFEKWTSLVNSLSGLFCASLNFIDSSKTTYPVRSFKPENNITLFDDRNELHLIRAALASEPVCTENLTPFVKFLPGRGKSGLSSLLDGHRVFESEWHKMSIDIETRCDGELCRYVMSQKIDAVIDIPRAIRTKKNPIPKPVSGNELNCDLDKPNDAFECFPLGDSNKLDFTLSDLLHRSILGGSKFSEKPAKVCAHVTDNWDTYLKVDGNYFGTPSNCFDVTGDDVYDLYFQTGDSTNVQSIKDVPIFVSRSLTGYGQDKGGSRTVFNNPLNEPVRLLYFESLPWFMRVYLHTVSVSGGGANELVKSVYYSPEVDRERPTHIEFELIIPANSTIALSYSFDKSLLLYSEYPPDANHGFSVEPGVVNVLEPVKYSLRTSSALLTLPTPDFSMPYNVIILSSTIMALAFGTLFNLLVKRLVTEEEADLVIEVSGPKAAIQKLKSKISVLKKSSPLTSKDSN